MKQKNPKNSLKKVKTKIGRLFTKAPKVETPKTVYKRKEKHSRDLDKEG